MSEFVSILERIRPGYKVGGLVEKGTELSSKIIQKIGARI